MESGAFGTGAYEYRVISKGSDGEESAITVKADKVYMSKGGDLAFYQRDELFFALAGGQWLRFEKTGGG